MNYNANDKDMLITRASYSDIPLPPVLPAARNSEAVIIL